MAQRQHDRDPTVRMINNIRSGGLVLVAVSAIASDAQRGPLVPWDKDGQHEIQGQGKPCNVQQQFSDFLLRDLVKPQAAAAVKILRPLVKEAN